MSNPKRNSPGRRSIARLRRQRDGEGSQTTALARRDSGAVAVRPDAAGGVGWDHDAAEPVPEVSGERPERRAPLTAQVLGILSDPRIHAVSAASASKSLGIPKADAEVAIEALVQAGELRRMPGSSPRYMVSVERKEELERMFRDAAEDLGETSALARVAVENNLMLPDDEDEPRLPVTAGLLSLFLPGTGQLLNGDVGRASLVFAVWSLALLTHLSPIWTFVALYAGAEAFFTAKIRSMERKLALESGGGTPPRPPEPETT